MVCLIQTNDWSLDGVSPLPSATTSKCGSSPFTFRRGGEQNIPPKQSDKNASDYEVILISTAVRTTGDAASGSPSQLASVERKI